MALGMTAFRRVVGALRYLSTLNTSALVMANMGATLFGILSGVATARYLGAASRGDLAVILFWPALLTSLLDAGLLEVVAIRTARRPDSWWSHARAAVVVAAGVGLLAVIGGWIALPLVLTNDQSRLLGLARAALVFIPLSLISNVPLGSLLGLNRYRSVAAIRTVTVVVYLAGLLWGMASGWADVETIVWLTVAMRGLPVCVGAVLLVSEPRRVAERASLRDVTAQAASLQSARVMAVTGASTDRILANWMLMPSAIGNWQIVSTVATIMPVVGQSAAQRLLSAVSTEGRASKAFVYVTYVRSVLATGLLAAGALVLLPVLIPLAYGVDFRDAVVPSMVLACVAVPTAGASVLQAAARGIGQAHQCVKAEALGVACIAGIGALSVPSYGLLGLASAVAIARIAVSIQMGRVIAKEFGLALASLAPWSKEFVAVARNDFLNVTGSSATRAAKASPAPGSDG